MTETESTYQRNKAEIGLTLLLLFIISAIAATHINPQGPFDARDFTRITGMKLIQPEWTALIEPLIAPLHIIIGAPDFRIAFLSCFIWIAASAAGISAINNWHHYRSNHFWTFFSKTASAGCTAAALMTIWIFAAMFAHIPGWKLISNDPNNLIVDPHSHTAASHDSFVTVEENLNWHRMAGFNVATITEHKVLVPIHSLTPPGNKDGIQMPAVIAGLEGHYGDQGIHLIQIGLHEPLSTPHFTGTMDDIARVTSSIHELQRGAVIAMSYNLSPDEATYLADAGVDGFEISNFGHPSIPESVRQSIISNAKRKGLVLLAASDWHGWSDMSRTWTVIENTKSNDMPNENMSSLTIDAIRNRDSQHVIPVVAGYMGPPTKIRAIFSPFIESIRYVEELSLIRVISWWAWSAIFLILTNALRRNGKKPTKILIPMLSALAGGTFIWFGCHLIFLYFNNPGITSFSFHIGICALFIGISTIGSVTWRHRLHLPTLNTNK